MRGLCGLAAAAAWLSLGVAHAERTAPAPGSHVVVEAGPVRSADPTAARMRTDRTTVGAATDPGRRTCTLATCGPRRSAPASGALAFGASALAAGVLARRSLPGSA